MKEENGECLLIKKGVEILHLRRTAALWTVCVLMCVWEPVWMGHWMNLVHHLFAHIFTPNNPYFVLRFRSDMQRSVCCRIKDHLFNFTITFSVESIIISWLEKLRMYNQSFPLFYFNSLFVSQYFSCFNDGPKMMVGNCTISILHLISSLTM